MASFTRVKSLQDVTTDKVLITYKSKYLGTDKVCLKTMTILTAYALRMFPHMPKHISETTTFFSFHEVRP